MTAIQLKHTLIQQISGIEDVSFLKAIKTILDSKTSSTPLSTKRDLDSKSMFLKGLSESVKEVSLAKKGKLKLQSAKDFLNEL